MKIVLIYRKKSAYWKKKLCLVEKDCNIGKKLYFVEKKLQYWKQSCAL